MHSHAASPTKPNIIVILSDDYGYTDYGYTDLGIYGIDQNVQTPAMDKRAAGGAMMKFGYSTAPQCVPSRAGLMSGRVQNTFGLRGNGDSDEPIPADVPTIAERIKKLGGYRTGFVGKWHLGNGAPAGTPVDPRHIFPYKDGKSLSLSRSIEATAETRLMGLNASVRHHSLSF